MIYLFILGRLLMGGYFVLSGFSHFKNHTMLTGYAASKGVPMSSYAVWLTGAMLVLGGLGIVFWLYVPIAILLLVVFLLVVSFMMHKFWMITDQMSRMSEEVNFKKNMALLGALLIILAIPLL